MIILRLFFISLFLLAACSQVSPTSPVAGPDKQAKGGLSGAALGAGAGAVWGAQVGAATGPAVFAGVGLGAFMGALSGLGIDLLEENQIDRLNLQAQLEELVWAQGVLAKHYQRRLELHPSRDIFPADWFFDGDEVQLTNRSEILARELAKMTKNRMPWSRIVVASYVTTSEPDSAYASYLNEKRASAIANAFVKYGVSGRRVFTKSITMPDPVLIDPDDDPFRYHQAIEIIPLD